MLQFVTVAKVGAIPEGQGATFHLDGRLVAVFLHQRSLPAHGRLARCGPIGRRRGGDLPLARLAILCANRRLARQSSTGDRLVRGPCPRRRDSGPLARAEISPTTLSQLNFKPPRQNLWIDFNGSERFRLLISCFQWFFAIFNLSIRT